MAFILTAGELICCAGSKTLFVRFSSQHKIADADEEWVSAPKSMMVRI
jgi:hypothetical protein